MIVYIKKQKTTLSYRILSLFIVFSFIFSLIIPPRNIYAQIVPQSTLNLPIPGAMVGVTDAYMPAIIKGLTVHPNNALEFDFIVDRGDTYFNDEELKEEGTKLIKYFLASLTVPNDELWVNLSPYEQDRIIPESFGQTEMGRDMLAQDYMLKQLMASLMYPENDLGKKFWNRVYTKAYEQFGTTQIPVNTFNKIWIVPENGVVYEHENTAYIVDSHLKVMLEEDYVALQENFVGKGSKPSRNNLMNQSNIIDYSLRTGLEPIPTNHNFQAKIIRDILIPEIEKEINEGEIFANLRQIYSSMLLATWYKSALQESLLGQIYMDQNKIKGIDLEDKQIKQKIYDQYVESFKKGVYNYIKEDYDVATQEVVPRKYFSGGMESWEGNWTIAQADSPLVKQIVMESEGLLKLYTGIKELEESDVRLSASPIGFTEEERRKRRISEIEELIPLIEKELKNPGSQDLPKTAIMSDFHGGLERFMPLLSFSFNNLLGFKGELDYKRSIVEQLKEQNLSLEGSQHKILFNGDIPDRGQHTIRIFMIIKELKLEWSDQIDINIGNHDEWMHGNLAGLHLPWYEGYNFYGDKEAEKLLQKYREFNPEFFETEEAKYWWAERLAEFNADQSDFEKRALDGKAKGIREDFIKFYDSTSSRWNEQQLDVMEKFIGYFKRIKVPSPYMGLSGLGKASAEWWVNVHSELQKGYAERLKGGGNSKELDVWKQAIDLAEQISQEVVGRLDVALEEGKWWYRIFESIQTQAYLSTEWNFLDWSRHAGWGTEVIAELNRLIKDGTISNENIDKFNQGNYLKSKTLQDIASFLGDNYNVFKRDQYSNLFSHGLFPVDKNGDVKVVYKGVTYTNFEIFEVFSLIGEIVENLESQEREVVEAIGVINRWYADFTTKLKPRDILQQVNNVGVSKINKNLRTRHQVSGHNPITATKLGLPFMVEEKGYSISFADFGMSGKYGGQGSVAMVGAEGVDMYGYEYGFNVNHPDRDVLSKAPPSHMFVIDKDTKEITDILKTIENPGLEAEVFLEGVKEVLMQELDELQQQTASSGIKDTLGGINLNPDTINFQIKRDGKGIPVPVFDQQLESIRIEGFVPVILNVTPVNLPLLLGFDDVAPANDDTASDNESIPDAAFFKEEELMDRREGVVVG